VASRRAPRRSAHALAAVLLSLSGGGSPMTIERQGRCLKHLEAR